MPTYRYRDKAGELVEVFMTMAELTAREKDGKLKHRGRTLTRDLAAEHSGYRSTAGNWPLKCFAMGVHPNRVGELRQHLREGGLPVEVAPDGDVIITGPEQYKKVQRALGFRPKNSYT